MPPPSAPLCQLVSLLAAIPDGVLDTAIRADEAGSEEDLYEDMHSSSHHYSHPAGGGEQLAINEVGSGLRGQGRGWELASPSGHSSTFVQA